MLEPKITYRDLIHQSERYLHAIATNNSNTTALREVRACIQADVNLHKANFKQNDNQTEQKQSARIQQLERALEQSLTYLAELRLKT